MSRSNLAVSRRSALTAGAIALLMSFLRPFAGTAHAQKAVLLAKLVPQIPGDPEDRAWDKADVLEVPLAPQAVVKPRTYEPGVSGIKTRALYDGDRLAFLLEWEDQDRDIGIGGVESFRDAVAVEFPADIAGKITYFAMGEPNNPVTIYQWKGDWEHGREFDCDEEFPNMAVDWYPLTGRAAGELAEGVDYGKTEGSKVFHTSWAAGSTLANPELQERTPVEKLQAEGFGTIASAEKQDAQGKSVWKDGKWRVVISIPRSQERFTFQQGKTVPVAFAAWNGAKRERGGEKSVSTWYFLALEQPTGPFVYISPLAAAAVAAFVQIMGMRLLRRGGNEDRETRG